MYNFNIIIIHSGLFNRPVSIPFYWFKSTLINVCKALDHARHYLNAREFSCNIILTNTPTIHYLWIMKRCLILHRHTKWQIFCPCMLPNVEKYKNKCIGLLFVSLSWHISAQRFASSEQLDGSKENLKTILIWNQLYFDSKHRVSHLIL